MGARRKGRLRRRDRPDPFVASIRKVARETDLYTVDSDGMPSDVVEERLATIEGLMPNALASIRRFQIPRRGTPERLLLASLLALQYIRTPDRMEMATFPVGALKSANGVRPVSKAAIIVHFFNPYDDRDPRDYPSELPTDAVVEERCRLPRELRRVWLSWIGATPSADG